MGLCTVGGRLPLHAGEAGGLRLQDDAGDGQIFPSGRQCPTPPLGGGLASSFFPADSLFGA